MDHSKILASALGLSIVLALVILGTGNAAAVGSPNSRWGGPIASAVNSGQGSNGWSQDTAKPPIQPNGSIAAKPNVTVTVGMWRNMRPTESALHEVSFVPAGYSVDCHSPGQESQGWIVGDASTMLGYCNGVWDLKIVPLSVQENLWGVQAISPTLAVAVGEGGSILVYRYETSPNDWVWTKYPMAAGGTRLLSVSIAKQNDGSYSGWAVGSKDPNFGNKGALVRATISAPTGAITKTHTSEWDAVTNDFALPPVYAYTNVSTLASNDSWAVGVNSTSTGGIIIHWDGSEWTVFQNVADPLYAVRMKSASEGWAVGAKGATYRFDGATWSKVPSPTTQALHGIDYGLSGEPWAVGFNNALMQYVGGSWQMVPTLYSDAFEFHGVDFRSGHGWVVGTHPSKGIGGQVLEFENGLWLPVTMPTDNRINAVATVSDTDAWAVGAADESGGTILHWDGRHWLRWYQRDMPIPKAELTTISMASATDGWAAGDLTVDGKAVLLHWDGTRWAPPRYPSPLNARINGIDVYKTGDLSTPVFAWAVAENGNAFAKYPTELDQWLGLPSCDFVYYQTRAVTIIPGPYLPGNWDAWAVGNWRSNVTNEPIKAGFLKFQSCGGENAWNWKQDAPGVWYGSVRQIYGIKMMPDLLGLAAGKENDHATIYRYNSTTGLWQVDFYQPDSPVSNKNPSNFYSVGILGSSEVAWFGGYYTNAEMGNKKWAFIYYRDVGGYHWVDATQFVPSYGINLYHRPIKNVQMGSDTMGWAVGDPEDPSPGGKSVIYQYPFPNFTLNTYPPTRAVLPTGSTTFTVTVNSLGAFDAGVSLSFPYPMPVGISATINPTTIDSSHKVATITVTTNGAAVGAYCLKLSGASTFYSGEKILSVSREVCLNLFVTYHPVNSVTPDHGRFGTDVTIYGTGFGADPGAGNRSTTANHVSWGNVQMPDSAVLTWSNTRITFRPPDAPGLFPDFPINGRVKVTASSSDSNDNFTFKMDPWISNLSTAAGPSAITISLTGTSFGNDPGSLNRNTIWEHVAIDGIPIAYSNVLSWSNNSVVFTVPTNSTGGMVTVTTNGFESNAVGFGNAANKEYLPLLRR